MKKKKYIPFVFFAWFLGAGGFAQNKGLPGNDVSVTSSLNKIEVAFDASNEIYNLLVLITDSTGKTIFLDNKYRFKGKYLKSFDLGKSKKGNFNVQVHRDDVHSKKTINVK
jgi:hypothetical protein